MRLRTVFIGWTAYVILAIILGGAILLPVVFWAVGIVAIFGIYVFQTKLDAYYEHLRKQLEEQDEEENASTDQSDSVAV